MNKQEFLKEVKKIVREEIALVKEDAITNINISSKDLKSAVMNIAPTILKDMKLKKLNKTATQELVKQVKKQFNPKKTSQKLKINTTTIYKMNMMGTI